MRQQQRPIRTRQLRFSPLFASHLASRDYDFYGEADFNAHIRVERRRTERTKKPLLLVLLDINALEKDRSRKRAIERIAYALCSCSRKIDIKGWYKASSVFGIVFTELPGGVREIRQKLVEKITRTLAGALRPDEMQKIKITQHTYPEEDKDDGTEHKVLDLYLYPDVTKKNSAGRLSPHPEEDNGPDRERRLPYRVGAAVSGYRGSGEAHVAGAGPFQAAPHGIFGKGIHLPQIQVDARSQ